MEGRIDYTDASIITIKKEGQGYFFFDEPYLLTKKDLQILSARNVDSQHQFCFSGGNSSCYIKREEDGSFGFGATVSGGGGGGTVVWYVSEPDDIEYLTKFFASIDLDKFSKN